MALYKRNKTWHTDFCVDGQRHRQSLHTSDWREAQKEEKKLIEIQKDALDELKRQNNKPVTVVRLAG